MKNNHIEDLEFSINNLHITDGSFISTSDPVDISNTREDSNIKIAKIVMPLPMKLRNKVLQLFF